MFKKHPIANISFLFIAIIISSLVILLPPVNTFSYDVFGYYMYLPLQFKYHDITIQNYDTIKHVLNEYHASETFYQAVKWDNGNWVMRYPIGLSVLFSPFYFIADFIVSFTSYPPDGFSRPYQLSVLYGCLFYTIVGLYFIKKIVTHFFSDKISGLALICLGLGTNYFFNTSIHGNGAMSHNILFSLYTLVLYLTIQWHQSVSWKHIFMLAIVIGLAAICRASEIICVIIPVFYGVVSLRSLKEKISLLIKYRGQILFFIGIIFSIGVIQLAYWKFASGRFIINPYGSGNPGEGFELLHPNILKLLFSFRKGWFIYTPMAVFIVIGFWYLFKKNRDLFAPIFIYFLINLYVVSSWSCWWYGSCFGNRALIPSYAILVIPLGYFLEAGLKSKSRFLILAIVPVFVLLNLFQSWQARTGIVDATNMSRPYYFSIFLQTSLPTHEQSKLLLKGKFNSGIENFTEEDSKTHSLSYRQVASFESENIDPQFLTTEIKHSYKQSLRTTANAFPSYTISVQHQALTKKSYVWIKASVWVYSSLPADSLNAYIGIYLKHNGYIFKAIEHPLNFKNFKQGEWCKTEYYYLTPDDLRSTKDLVCVYFLNKGKSVIYIDDLTLESFEPIIDKSVF